MRKSDKLILIGLAITVIVVIGLVIVAISGAGKLVTRYQKIKESTPGQTIMLPLGNRVYNNSTAMQVCNQFNLKPWNTPLYGTVYLIGNGSNRNIIVYCKTGNRSLAILYTNNINSNSFLVGGKFVPKNN